MPHPSHNFKAPRRIFLVLGWTGVMVGLLLFSGGYYMSHQSTERLFGMFMAACGGCCAGGSGRLLVACKIARSKTRV